jgi:hypothetical protein
MRGLYCIRECATVPMMNNSVGEWLNGLVDLLNYKHKQTGTKDFRD